MQIDIYIREKVGGKREVRIPLIPEEISFSSGNATTINYDIMELGEVVIPSGTEPGSWSWKSELPGPLRKEDPMIRGKWAQPRIIDSFLNDWKRDGTELNLLVTGYPINADVYLTEYKAAAGGAFGDIYYEIAFTEARHIVVTSTTDGPPEEERPSEQPSSYTIKKGDTLWAISLQFYGTGTKWGVIYEANKDIIEQTAQKYGRSSSDNGHWIYPGVTLTIPAAE